MKPRASKFAAFLGRLFLRVNGWKIDGGPPAYSKAVIIAAPHTSNWDLVYSFAVAWVLGMKIHWVGKHTLFTVPIWGSFMRRLGGIPVDRTAPQGAVEAIAQQIRQAPEMLVMVPPEGTRSKSKGWKSGFYWIAHSAGVPIILGYLDYGRKRAGVSTALFPTGDIEKDFVRIQEFYAGVHGKRSAMQGEVRLGKSTA